MCAKRIWLIEYESLIKRGIEGVEILCVQAVGGQAKRFTEALVMHDLSLPQEFDRVTYVRVVAHPEDVVVGRAGFLFGSQILMEIGDGVALGLHIRRRPRHAACRRGINAGGMIHIIRREAGIHNLFAAEIARELMHDRADHFQMPQFFRAYRGHSI